MPTSATGTSIKTRPRRPRPRPASGFTLLEVLVVVIIIGIITSMAMVSVKVLGGDHEMDKEAARLQAILLQSREDAMLVGTDVGMRVDLHGYDFLRYDSRKDLWQPVTDDPMLRPRALPAGMTARLRLEGRDVALKKPDEKTNLLADGEAPVQPQVVVQASGDLAPFDVVLQRDGTQEERRIAGTVDGKIEVHDDARERP
jgi:general secretion pathway protein H